MIKMGDHGEILKWISENSLSFELISYLNSALDLLQHLLETGLVQHLLTVNYRKSLSLRIAYPPDRFFVRINRTVLGLAVTVSIDVGVVSIMFFLKIEQNDNSFEIDKNKDFLFRNKTF